MERAGNDILNPIITFVEKNMAQYLVEPQPRFLDFADHEDSARRFVDFVDKMVRKYDEKYEQEVKPAFAKFDKDGSGAIDKSELSQLSTELGHPLDDDQLEKALVDLDLNKDGVIDLPEFCRWYFTGMKSYNDSTRNLMVVSKAGLSLAKAIASNEVFAIVSKDKTVNHIRGKVQLNNPKDGLKLKV